MTCIQEPNVSRYSYNGQVSELLALTLYIRTLNRAHVLCTTVVDWLIASLVAVE